MDVTQMTDVTAILRNWEESHDDSSYDPVPTLTRLAELIEVETENYYKMDPDPFDERHPSRADPNCHLGHILKVLFRKDVFMTKLVNDYLRDTYWSRLGITGHDVDNLNIAACRLMLDTLPGLETSAVFQPDMDGLINRLLKWATSSKEPLQSYATGLLAAAMEVPEIATRYREQNSRLIPSMLERLRNIQEGRDVESYTEKTKKHNGEGSPNDEMVFKNNGVVDDVSVNSELSTDQRPFAHLSGSQNEVPASVPNGDVQQEDCVVREIITTPTKSKERYKDIPTNGLHSSIKSPAITYNLDKARISLERTPVKPDQVTPFPVYDSGNCKKRYIPSTSTKNTVNSSKSPDITESSNSSWAELESYVIGNVQIFPPTPSTRQILILKYLTPMGEYQEFLSHVFEHNALGLILNYINVKETRDSRLAFEALKYLASLLCHKKFSIEFINVSGLQRLLEVPRPSVAATGVSICLYYLSYCTDAMERVCLLPQFVINHLVKYALWLLECSHHDSGRCHAIMFFGLTFQFKVILDTFDEQDGLRKLYNVISTLPILSTEEIVLNDDVECAARQIVRHVCVAFKRYLDAHLYIRSEQLRRSVVPLVNYKALCKVVSSEEVQERVDTLLELLPYRAHWPPVDELLRLGAVTLLLQVIAFAYEWNYSGRAETVRSALDVLAICAIMPRVQMLFCERVDLPEETITVGINIILGAAEGEIVADPDVQKAALSVIVTCVCAPVNRMGGSLTRFSSGGNSPRKKTNLRSSEELIQKVWDSVRTNNGIMVLLQLMQVKTPITDADCIRTLACRALAGLARSDTVRQILGKLPLFTNGQLQNLMRDPILQEKRQEHVLFQKYALELMERVSGNTKHSGSHEIDVSLANIHRANVVAQTRIQFNDKQLLQLIHQHLVGRNLSETAATLQKEAQLNPLLSSFGSVGPSSPAVRAITGSITGGVLSPFRYTLPLGTPVRPPRLTYTPGSHHHQHRPSTSASFNNSLIDTTPDTSASSLTSTPSTIKLTKKSLLPTLHQQVAIPQNSRLEKQTSRGDSCGLGPLSINSGNPDDITAPPRVTLDSIITEYLTNQHALCKNPMATCPQFNLFVPHKCPDPKPHYTEINNFTVRHARRELGFYSPILDRRLVHSRFCPVQTFRLGDSESGFFTCACFMPCGQVLMVATYNGEVKHFNVQTGNEEAIYHCHDAYINHLEAHRSGKLLLTSSTWRQPLSALWDVNQFFDMKFPLNEEEYTEFSNLTQDKIIGTKAEVATIYDVATGKKLFSLIPSISNQYTKNKATFSPTDELILSDGVLWDASSNQQIHKFDKLNQTQSGVFHPNGLEVVSNAEVWDLRTFHLLKTVPALNQSHVVFSPPGDIIYSLALEQENMDDTTFETSFKTLDAADYSSIATIDVKKNIYSVCVNRYDTQIALVENQGMFDAVQESVVRLYDVGRRRDDEDDQEEEEDDEDMDGSEDGSGSGSGSDNDEENINILLGAVHAATSQRDRRRTRNRSRRANRNGDNDANNGNADENNGNAENNEAVNNGNEGSANDDDEDDDDEDDEDWTSMSTDDDNDDEGGEFQMSDTSDMDAYSLEDMIFD